MGLKISKYEKEGQSYTDAYTKVGNVQIDNNTKTAMFTVKVFDIKGGKEIDSLLGQRITLVGNDVLSQCYAQITKAVEMAKANVTKITAELEGAKDDSEKQRKQFVLDRITKDGYLQLDGAVEE
jgi:2-keto-3-deoxy-galactonokinase